MMKSSISGLEKVIIYFPLLLIQGVKLLGGSVLRLNTVTASCLTHTSSLVEKTRFPIVLPAVSQRHWLMSS